MDIEPIYCAEQIVLPPDLPEILRAYTDPLGLTFDEEAALAFALARGNRSGRTAYQFATELAGRAGLSAH